MTIDAAGIQYRARPQSVAPGGLTGLAGRRWHESKPMSHDPMAIGIGPPRRGGCLGASARSRYSLAGDLICRTVQGVLHGNGQRQHDQISSSTVSLKHSHCVCESVNLQPAREHAPDARPREDGSDALTQVAMGAPALLPPATE